MKERINKIYLLLLLSIVTSQGLFAQAGIRNNYYANSYALVIGINQYKNAGWPNLDNAVKGAEAFKSMLADHHFNVISLYNEQATKSNIMAKVQEIMGRAQAKDRFLLYFAGHGQKKGVRGFLVPFDGKSEANYVPLKTIIDISQKVNAKHQLYVLDACYAGFIKTRGDGLSAHKKKDPKYLQKVTKEISRRALTSGGKNEKVLDSGGPDGHSPFTGHFLLGIRKGKADGNGDGYVTLAEIQNYLLPNATSDYSQPAETALPGDKDGVFVFVSELGATKKFDTIRVGGKVRANTKKSIKNPAYKNEHVRYTEELSAADWLDMGDETGSISRAIHYYSRALQLYPEFTAALYNRAIAWEDSAEYDEDHAYDLLLKAADDYQQVLAVDAYDIDCLFNLGSVYFHIDRYTDALNAFNRALDIDPEDKYSLSYKGDVLLEMGRADEAFTNYFAAVNLDPEDAYLYYDRGTAYKVVGNFDAAMDDLNHAISLYAEEGDFYEARSEVWKAFGNYEAAYQDSIQAEHWWSMQED